MTLAGIVGTRLESADEAYDRGGVARRGGCRTDHGHAEIAGKSFAKGHGGGRYGLDLPLAMSMFGSSEEVRADNRADPRIGASGR
jgi:hypothetical protein